MDCDIKIIFPKNYFKHLPPIKSNENDKLKLYISPTLESIMHLHEVHSMIALKIKLTVKWQDSRLTYAKIHPKRHNLITLSQKNDLWLPSLLNENTFKDATELFFDDELSLGIVQLKAEAEGEVASMSNSRKFQGIDGQVKDF